MKQPLCKSLSLFVAVGSPGRLLHIRRIDRLIFIEDIYCNLFVKIKENVLNRYKYLLFINFYFLSLKLSTISFPSTITNLILIPINFLKRRSKHDDMDISSPRKKVPEKYIIIEIVLYFNSLSINPAKLYC